MNYSRDISVISRMFSGIKFLATERVTLIYLLVTLCYIILFRGKLSEIFWPFIGVRILVFSLIVGLAWVYAIKPFKVIYFLRQFLPFLFLSYWYPETYYFNEFIFQNLDSYLVLSEQYFFGSQPSLEFSKIFPQAWFSELMYFGYISYYFLFFGTALWLYFKDKILLDKFTFIVIGSFYIYFLIYFLLPVVGPQFYFNYPDNVVPEGYYISDLMRFLQNAGEKPTAAFPSSHVSITLTVLIFMWLYCRKLLIIALPVGIILICSTVYIKAHYLLDVIGAFIAVLITYPFINWLYTHIQARPRIYAQTVNIFTVDYFRRAFNFMFN